jgi:hypothetical protein
MVSALVVLLAASDGFKPCGQHEGVAIASRRVAGSPFVELRFTLEAEGDLDAMCGAAFGSGKIEPNEQNVKLRQVLEESEDARVSYEQIAPPMVSRRDFVMSLTRSHPQPGACRVEFTSVDSAPKRPGLIRLKHISGSFVFRPLAGGRVGVEHRIHMEPGGALAPFMVEPSRQRLGAELVRRIARSR